MPYIIYIYKDHKITGPNNYSVNIISSDRGKHIDIEGSDNLTLERHGKKYVITHNFIDEGNVEKNSIMEYRENKFNIQKKGMANIKNRRINFGINHDNDEIAYVNTFKDSLNINIENTKYIVPVIIYISILSTRLKTKFGKIYLKGKIIQVPALLIISSLLSFSGISVHKSVILYAFVAMATIGAGVLLVLLQRGSLF